MAKKKYKNFKLEQDELKPIVVGAFESRKKTSFGIFIILTIFVLVVVFLPEISQKIDEFLNPTTGSSVIDEPETPTNPEEPLTPSENIDETFYDYVENLTIERVAFTVNNIVINTLDNTISYNVTNTTNTYQNMEELNYYIEIYNSQRTLLERVKLVNNNSILASGAFENYTRSIDPTTASTAGYIVLVKKTTEDYPEVTLPSNNSMVCKKEHETVTYEFNENKLTGLTSIIEYLSTDPSYTEIYSNYQTLANAYNTSTGITSTFFNSTSGFNITTIVNLEQASRTNIFNADSFTYETDPKIVSFEMESLGFDCN